MQKLSNATVGQSMTLFSMILSFQTFDGLPSWMKIENRHEFHTYLVCLWVDNHLLNEKIFIDLAMKYCYCLEIYTHVKYFVKI